MKHRRFAATLMKAGLALHAPLCMAQSSVNISGLVDLFAGHRQLAGQASLTKLDSGGMTTTRWAFEGGEDLGGGMSAQFAMSGTFRADTGEIGRNPTDVFWSRFSYVGLKNEAGTIRLGRQTTPTFLSAIRFSPFGESVAFSPYMLHMFGPAQPLTAPINSLDGSTNNAISYISPDVGGFTGVVQYSFDKQIDSNLKRWSLGGTYAVGPLAASVTTERTKIPGQFAATASNLTNVQAGASYDFGVVKAYAQASRSTLDLLAGGERRFATVQLGVSVPAGPGLVLASYARTKKDEPRLADVHRSTVTLGYDYFLSKRTDLYAVALHDKASGLANGKTIAFGIRHRF